MSEQNVEYSEDELEPPAWLDEKFFTDVLKHSEKSEKIEVTKLKLSPATTKGDHYASVMFRALVDYRLSGEDKQKSMILKTMPEAEGNKKEIFEDSHIFETEIGIYTEIIPKFESVLRAAGDKTILGPKVIYHSLSDKKVLILEDISPLGYNVLRGRYPTLEESKAGFTKIAKWHAVGYKLNLEQLKLFDEFRYGVFSITNLSEQKTFVDGIRSFIEMLNENDDLKEYKKYFEAMKDNSTQYCRESFNEYRENPQPGGIYGLCHGDFHFKNMMFKYDEKSGKFQDVMLIDYQMSYAGPIVNDIIYFKYLTLSSEDRAKHWNELLYYYVTTFQQTLRKIGFQGRIPTIMDFRQELLRQRKFEVFVFTTFLPLWNRIAYGQNDLQELINSPDIHIEALRTPSYVSEVRSCLPNFLHSGYFEN